MSVSGRYVAEIAGDQNKAMVQRFYAEAINGRDLDLESVLHQHPLACWMLGRVDDGSIRDPAALATRANVDGHALAASVAQLRAAGFVTDDTGPATLTPAGTEALGRLRVAWGEELCALVADWEPDTDPELNPLIARLAEELARPRARPNLTAAPPRVRACRFAIRPTTASPGSTWGARCSA